MARVYTIHDEIVAKGFAGYPGFGPWFGIKAGDPMPERKDDPIYLYGRKTILDAVAVTFCAAIFLAR